MISHEVVLACAPERAFALFTQRASEWWPASRRHTGDPTSTIVIAAPGDFYEESGGHRVPLGRVTAWDPPERLTFEFYPGTDPEHPTEATITFTAESAGTRVRVEHRPTARSEHLWDARAPRYAASWEAVFASLAAATS